MFGRVAVLCKKYIAQTKSPRRDKYSYMRFFCWLLQLKVTGKRNVLQVSFAFSLGSVYANLPCVLFLQWTQAVFNQLRFTSGIKMYPLPVF